MVPNGVKCVVTAVLLWKINAKMLYSDYNTRQMNSQHESARNKATRKSDDIGRGGLLQPKTSCSAESA
jgi:hypothetical protein